MVSLAKFEEIDSTIKLLSSTDEIPINEEESAKLNLLVEGDVKISGLNSETEEQSLFTLQPNSSNYLSFDGSYYGETFGMTTVEYSMMIRVEAVSS